LRFTQGVLHSGHASDEHRACLGKDRSCHLVGEFYKVMFKCQDIFYDQNIALPVPQSHVVYVGCPESSAPYFFSWPVAKLGM
jgi:hypothetical protein